MDSNFLRIHALQLNSVWEKRKENHSKVEKLLKSVSIQENDLIILPEMFDTGFSMTAPNTIQKSESSTETFLKSISNNYQALLIAGGIGRNENQQALNLAYCTSHNENTRYYCKQQPFTLTNENKVFQKGNHSLTLNWLDWKISPFICYDLRFPELFRKPAKLGTQLFIVIANWPEQRSEHWLTLLKARAIENQAYVLGVNRCGSDPNVSYDGKSALFDPLGETVFICDQHEQIQSATVNLETVLLWRNKFPALEDSNL